MSYLRYDRSGWRENQAYDSYDRPDRESARVGTPGKRTLTEGLTRRAAEQGTSTAPTELPHREKIQTSFGPDHDVSGIQAHVGGGAAESARELRATAYASGNHVVFADQPDLHTAAHEAAHVIQQAQGVSFYGGMGQAGDDHERAADAIADRVVAGQSAADLLGPAASRPIASGVGSVQRKEDPEAERENVFWTNNGSAIDEKTGVFDHQVEIVDDFCAAAQRHLDTWAQQRGGKTADLRFSRGDDMASEWSNFRNRLAKDPAPTRVAWEGARKRLDTPKNRQFIREIRMFANDMLKDYRNLLELEDAPPSHEYELKPISDDSIALGAFAKIGVVTRTIEIRYKNSEIPGLTWTQEVKIDGHMFAIEASTSGLKKAGKGKGPKKVGGGADVAMPGGWRKPDGQPVRYLPPDFFDGAAFTRAGQSAEVEAAGLEGGAAGSTMVIGNTVGQSWMKLAFSFPAGFAFSTEPPSPKGAKPSAEASGVIESGTTSTAGTLKFEGGEWEDEEEDTPKADVWLPLHAAQIYFPTGSSELDGSDEATVAQVIRAIDERAHMPDYQFTRFKIEVIGCHSRMWEGFDKKIAKLNDLRASGKISEDKYQEKMRALEMEKDASNDSLAYLRAVEVKHSLMNGLYSIQHRLAFDIDEKRRFEEATTRKPIDDDPEGNLGEDRSVYVIVRYRL